jgi:hypothetical protein
MQTSYKTLSLSIILAGFLSAPLFGQEGASATTNQLAQTRDRAWISGGIFYPRFDSSARLDAENGDIGTGIDLEKDLGLDESLALFSFQGGFYFTERFRVELEYFDLDRSSNYVLDRDIMWGDEVYEIGANVGARFDVAFTRLAIGYDIFQKENYSFGVAVGAHFMDASLGIQAFTTIEDSETDRNIDTDASTSGLLPVPNIGFYGNYILGNRWRIEGRMDWFGIKIGEWDGILYSAEVNLQYYFTKNVSIGVGLQYFLFDVEYDNADWNADLSYEYFGPKLNLGFHF